MKKEIYIAFILFMVILVGVFYVFYNRSAHTTSTKNIRQESNTTELFFSSDERNEMTSTKCESQFVTSSTSINDNTFIVTQVSTQNISTNISVDKDNTNSMPTTSKQASTHTRIINKKTTLETYETIPIPTINEKNESKILTTYESQLNTSTEKVATSSYTTVIDSEFFELPEV